MLSHPLPIFALVGRCPTNRLIGRGSVPRRNHTFGPGTLSGITGSFPPLSRSRGKIIHALLSLSPLEYSRRSLSARLACLIHAANVHSEPGSNPSIVYALIRIRIPVGTRTGFQSVVN